MEGFLGDQADWTGAFAAITTNKRHHTPVGQYEWGSIVYIEELTVLHSLLRGSVSQEIANT